jgi:sensor histidine kinase YesM
LLEFLVQHTLQTQIKPLRIYKYPGKKQKSSLPGREIIRICHQKGEAGLFYPCLPEGFGYLCSSPMKMKKPAGKKTRFITVLVHVLVWLGLFMIPFIDDRQHISAHFLIRISFTYLLLAGFFYFNYLVLIPRLFLRKKIGYFVFGVVAGLLLVSFIQVGVVASLEFLGFPGIRHGHNYIRLFLNTLFPAFFIFTVSTAIRIINEWFRAEKQKKEMENEKLNAELAFLKSQVNPHFLFNILNNICSLARKKSDDTENAIIRLSQIMRYMLSDSKDEKVNLEKEVEYLRNYIELQQLRISDKVQVNFSLEGMPETKTIEPMLLIPFVENAFKHGVSYREESVIDIFLKVLDSGISFRIENTVFRKEGEPIALESGIGLKNVLRRLELLYPGSHRIDIRDTGQKYRVDLQIAFAS